MRVIKIFIKNIFNKFRLLFVYKIQTRKLDNYKWIPKIIQFNKTPYQGGK